MRVSLALVLAAACSPSLPQPSTDAAPLIHDDVEFSAPRLAFASVGDTRPGQTCHALAGCAYPSQLIGRIYQRIQQIAPPVSLVVSTGDYQYNAPGDGTAEWQVLSQYLPAARQYRGPVFAAMGNHECNGYTRSNCLPEGPLPCTSEDLCGVTENLAAFLSLLAQMGVPGGRPYYSIRISLPGGFEAKFVFTAPNAWDSYQELWLSSVLARRTAYTFVVQHEPNALDQTGASAPDSLPAIRKMVLASGAPAAGEIYPVTLWIVGHTHNFDYDPANQQVINGLGGAPTDQIEDGEDPAHFYRTSDGAYLVCAQQRSGSPPALQCELFDSKTGAIVGGGTSFAVNADGTPAALE